MHRAYKIILGLVLCFGLACAQAPAAQALSPTMPSRGAASGDDEGGGAVDYSAARASGGGGSVEGYVLGTGDRIKLTVYGEADLSGEYEVGSTGIVAMPLIGDVSAAGQSLQAFERAVRQKLAAGYLRDPRVSAQVVNYRPFFILGEVSKPGSYPYVNGMTVISAVALAGGYTYRADKKGVTVSHAGDPQKTENPVTEESTVRPGDIIRVPERFF